MWVFFAALSALFAGCTAILSKCGVRHTGSDVATAIRTSVILSLTFVIAMITGELWEIGTVSLRSLSFLLISGLCTGASWLCYMKALSMGEVTKVTAIDKSSLIFSVLLALLIFPAERTLWWVKLLCLAAVAAGVFLMVGTRPHAGYKKSNTALFFALLSALFAAATSILAKIGIENISSNLATMIRTCVVLVFAWLIVFCKKEAGQVRRVPRRELLFLVASGAASAASWLCYYYALAKGQVSAVVCIDKLSVVVTVLFSCFVLRERPTRKTVWGLFLLTAGTILMAVFA